MGRVVDTEEFVRICLTLEKRGAENINLVTGSHAIPAIVRGLDAARKAGLAIPALWNTSSYENPAALEMLKDRIDSYLPDLKTLDKDVSARFFRVPDYGERAAAAILKMMEFRPSGVIIRHLILPGYLESTRETLRWFAENARGRARLSLMTQFTPVAGSFPDRPLNREEYDMALGWLDEFGINDGFFQEFSAESGWLPDFSRRNPFAAPGGEDLAEPVWHWKEGFVG
jgi:putative pyruvate formate lyase activating enzyme